MKKWIASFITALTLLLIAAPAASAAGIVPGPDNRTDSTVSVLTFLG